jgi:hypothetical protein
MVLRHVSSPPTAGRRRAKSKSARPQPAVSVADQRPRTAGLGYASPCFAHPSITAHRRAGLRLALLCATLRGRSATAHRRAGLRLALLCASLHHRAPQGWATPRPALRFHQWPICDRAPQGWATPRPALRYPPSREIIAGPLQKASPHPAQFVPPRTCSGIALQPYVVGGSRPAPGGSSLARPPAWLHRRLMRAAPAAVARCACVRLWGCPPAPLRTPATRAATYAARTAFVSATPPGHLAPRATHACNVPPYVAGLLSRAPLAASFRCSGHKQMLHSLASARASVRAVTPWLSRHFVYGAATAAAYVLPARATGCFRSAGWAGCGGSTKTRRIPPHFHCVSAVKGASRRCATPRR